MSEILNTDLSKIKQPKPSFDKNDKTKKTFNYPKTGVLSTPKISNMPLLDEYIKKQNENPRQVFKSPIERLKFLNLQNIISVLIGVFSIASISSIIKEIKK